MSGETDARQPSGSVDQPGQVPAHGTAAGAGGSQDLPAAPGLAAAPANPFTAVRTWTIIPWVIVGSIVLILALHLVALPLPLDLGDPNTTEILAMLGVYGALGTWVLWACRRSRVNLRRLVGRAPPGYGWIGQALGILLAAVAFSLGSAFLLMYALSQFAPDLLRWLFEALAAPEDPSVGYHVAMTGVAVVLAPVLEETVFRGMLVNRLGVKWGMRTALIVSSILFGILHANPIGIGVVGLVAAVLYLKTRTLIVPIAFHAANNLGATVAGFLTDTDEPMDIAADIQSLQDVVIPGFILVAVSLPIVIWYLRRNWPARDAAIPYMGDGNQALDSHC